MYDANNAFACLKGTAKHIMTGVTNEDGLHKILDIAAMIAGGMDTLREKPFISAIASFAISPLKLCTQSTSGQVHPDKHGLITIPRVGISAQPAVLSITPSE